MTTRRANGEHSIYQRGDGKWCAALVATDPVTGKRSRTVLYGRTRTEVRQKLREAAERAELGGPVRDSKATVAQWLEQWRSTTLAVSDRKESTRVLYGSLSRKHLDPGPFGETSLDRLRPTHVEALVLALRVKGLADSTVRTTYTVLRAALDGAVRDGLLARNPAAVVRRPGVARTEARHLSAAEVVALLEAASTSRHHTALALIAATGLRRGEALGLRWGDVDLPAATLTVRATLGRVAGALTLTEPKTARSRRTVPLSPGLVAMLRAHRLRQLEDRMRAANVWTETGHVFATETGQPVDPRNLLRALTVAAGVAGLPDVGVHTLRHSAAVTWLEAGVHTKAVSDLLGHSSIAITGDVYGHTSDDTARAAIAGLSTALGVS